MLITRDRISALIFIALSIVYIVLSGDIELYPGEEEELFHARTFPTFVGYLALIASSLMFILPARGEQEALNWSGMDWWRVAGLCVVMVVYGLSLIPVGFFVSTCLFLLAGFLILGERRWKVLLLASLPLTAGMQYVLHGLLDIYITDPVLTALGVIS